MRPSSVVYSFVADVTTPHGARLTACGRVRAAAGYPRHAYEAAADAAKAMIGHRPNPSKVKLAKVRQFEACTDLVDSVIAACDVWGVTRAEILGRTRTERVNKPRFAVYGYLRDQCGLPYNEVAKLTGRRCHGTIVNGVQKLRDWVKTDARMRAKVDEFHRRLCDV